MSQQPVTTPTSTSEIRGIVGPLEDAVITSVLATGASAAEVLEAYTWLTADDQLGTELQRNRSGRVGQVYTILADALEPAAVERESRS
jgi:hypothetical protein